MRTLLIFILLVIVSCKDLPSNFTDGSDAFISGTEEEPRRFSTSDNTFDKYISAFEQECNCNIDDIPINFATDIKERVGENKVGVCWWWSSGETEIEIDPDYWDALNEGQREQLIFHELGHCAYNKVHNDDHVEIDGNTCPESIMRSYIFSVLEIEDCYNTNYDHYRGDLF